jgi:hypothetical protein
MANYKYSMFVFCQWCVYVDLVVLMLFSLEGEVSLVPKRGCLLTLAYYAFPRWYEFGERRWNDILTGENRRSRRRTCPSATLATTNPTWINPGANPGLRCERPATNDLSYGTAGFSTLFDQNTLIELIIIIIPVIVISVVSLIWPLIADVK